MSALADLGLLVIRGMVGYVMFFHGSQKLFGWFGGPGMEAFTGMIAKMNLPGGAPPSTAAYAAATAEFGGGILLMLGFGTRIAAIFVAFTMGVAAFMVHGGKFSAQNGGMEYPLTLMCVAIGLMLTGPGRLSLDNLFSRTPKLPPVK